jgi:hypothetical protein
MGDYLARLERYEEAREEYQRAREAYQCVLPSCPDSSEAQTNQEIILKKLNELPKKQKSSEIYRLERLFETNLPQDRRTVQKKQINLSQWFQNIVEEGWQTIEQLFVPEDPCFAYVYALRGGVIGSSIGSAIGTSVNDIDTLIQVIYTNQDEESRKQAALRLGAVGKATPEVLTALIHLIQTTQDEETRWGGAESLWQLDSENVAAGIRRVKDLGIQLGKDTVALMVAVLPKTDQTIAVLLRVYPMGEQRHLPPHLVLIVLDEIGNKFLEVEARELAHGLSDHYIQLKFSGLPGEKFSVKVALGEIEITEEFVL